MSNAQKSVLGIEKTVSAGRDGFAGFLKSHGVKLFCLLLSFCFLMITSKNSFLYPLNDWVDTNAFFTVGKSMFNGVVPYKDLFEQKGLLLYLIYGLGYLISHTSFHGVFLFEVLFFTVFLYFSHKCFLLFVNDGFSFVMLPVLSFITVTSEGFVHGGSAEEFCLPFYAYTLYSFLRHFKERELTPKDLAVNGFAAGCVFMIKYTLLGFWFAFMMFIFFDLIFTKKIKKAFLSCLWFLAGMAVPIVIGFIYLLINSAVPDFIDCYFKINMTAYNREKFSLADKIKVMADKFPRSLFNTSIYVCILTALFPFALIPLKIKKYAKFSLIGSFFISVFLMFFGLRFYRYYILPVVIFTVPALIGIAYLLSLIFSKLKLKGGKWLYGLYVPAFAVFVFLSFEGANYKEMIGMKKGEMFQFRYAEYINKFENPTLLNMGYLDAGLYTAADIVPNTRFFEVQNIPYDQFPDNIDEMRASVRDRKTSFVLYFTVKNEEYVKENYPEIYENYKLVFDDSQLFEKSEYNAFFYELKE